MSYSGPLLQSKSRINKLSIIYSYYSCRGFTRRFDILALITKQNYSKNIIYRNEQEMLALHLKATQLWRLVPRRRIQPVSFAFS